MVASVLRLRPRLTTPTSYRAPWFPLLPWVFIVVMSAFVLAALVYNPVESIIGCGLALLGIPVFHLLTRAPATGAPG
jgi:APA family basic amino acid/polyamine antiporter